jgi:hypothetical protein
MLSRNKQGERRWSPATFKLLLTTHVIVSVGWLGVVIAKIVLKIIAMTTSDPASFDALVFAAGRLSFAFPPLAIATIVTGVLLSIGTKWGLIQHYWVATKIVLTFGVIITAVQLGTRIPQPRSQVVDNSRFLGLPASPMALLFALTIAHLVMLMIATILSTHKPWGKTWFGRRKAVQPQRGRAILETADRTGSARGHQPLGEPVE